MTVLRIVADLESAAIADSLWFWRDVLGMEVVMDQGWIVTLASSTARMPPQISLASEGGSGTPVPDLSIEVDDLEDIFRKLTEVGHPVEYGPVDEPWGVRRFFTREPGGRLVNLLQHRR
ncbi:MAG: VOC family protein [Geminicoccaceae bacterium]